MNQSSDTSVRWIPLQGEWQAEPKSAVFHGAPGRYGLALADRSLRDGIVEVTVTIHKPRVEGEADGSDELGVVAGSESPDAPQAGLQSEVSAQVILGYESMIGSFVAVGLGGGGFAGAYSFSVATGGWAPLQTLGDSANIEPERPYHLRVSMQGQVVRLSIDTVQTIACQVSTPLLGMGAGLFARGHGKIKFDNFTVNPKMPQGFAVMDFSEKFQDLYTDVLQPESQTMGISLIRADEIPGPGFIISDIVRKLQEASIVVAEISQTNANVYFELGYAYAFNKPLILLAEKGRTLPFDVASMRVIFYEDSIGGKARVQAEFRRHLQALLGR